MSLNASTVRYPCRIRFATAAVFLLTTSLLVTGLKAEASAGRTVPTVIITVDVESTYQNDHPLPLPEQIDTLCVGRIPCGMREMVNILKEHGEGATFFLNVFEYTEHGESFLEQTGKWLRDSGQDVQLHTHPQWRYDRNRNMMYQYSLEEQTKIIRDGKELLQKWTDSPVIAHRAGAYSADENTLKALVANGILIDSSLFHGRPDSRINSLGLGKNVLSLYGPLYEFPVTVYKKNEYPSFLGSYVPPLSSIRKYDINWFRNQQEAEKAIREAMQLRMDFIVLFLHSYSFIKACGRSGQTIADAEAIERFKSVLEFVRMQGMEVRTLRQIADRKSDLTYALDRQDVIPEISLHLPFLRYVRSLADMGRHDYKGVILLFGIILASIAVSVTLVRWRMARSNPAFKKRP